MKSGPPSLRMYLLWKFVGMVIGGIAGGILGGNAMVWLSQNPADVWRVAFPVRYPHEGIIGAVEGVLVGGMFTGGRVGLFGYLLLLGTIVGLFVGNACSVHNKIGPHYQVHGLVAGILIGLSLGLFFEINCHGLPPFK